MDPNANLDEMLELSKQLLAGELTYPDEAAVRLAELIEGLDHWITGGGFLPERWQQQKGRK